MKTATLTFHASHNYGSMLQAYALQQVLLGMGHSNEIINLRIAAQKAAYPFPPLRKPRFEGDSFFRHLAKQLLYLAHRPALVRKHKLFEKFLRKRLVLTDEISSASEVDISNYQCLISGGDQIWNPSCVDFDPAYFLPFEAVRKLSYAPSAGPVAAFEETAGKWAHCLISYDALSVRDEGMVKVLEKTTGRKVKLCPDPVLLLSAETWQALAGEPIVKGDYIFVYTPSHNIKVYEKAREIGRKMGMKVIVSDYNPKLTGMGFNMRLACGPVEFLNLLKNARIAVSASYHCTLFSALFHVPFIAVDGMSDARVAPFLAASGFGADVINEDFAASDSHIATQRRAGLEFLRESI